MTDTDSANAVGDFGPPRMRRFRRHAPAIIIVLMTAAFGVTVWQRDRIRSAWWAFQLTRCGAPADCAHYLASLAVIGEAGHGSIARLARHDDASVRSMAVAVLSRTPASFAVPQLSRLLADPDVHVRESAALTLALIADDSAGRALIAAAASGDPSAAAAAFSALPRVRPGLGERPLLDAVHSHPAPAVRAQAAESLGELVASGAASQPLDASDARIIAALVDALADNARFTGELALERSVRAAARFAAAMSPGAAASGPAARDYPRTVADAAAGTLSELTGRTVTQAMAATPGQRADLADRCALWVAERRNAHGSPQSPTPGGPP